MDQTASVGVFGATGYTGREALRLVAGHPSLRLAFATGSGRLAHDAGLERRADAYLLCLPHGVSATFAVRLRAAYPEALVIDLSGDLRLPNAAAYKAWYGHDHPAPELLGQVPYGLPEITRAALPGARLISNPGCYATAMLLPLVALLRAGVVAPDDIVVDAKSGASGAGRSLREDLLFCELTEDFSAYAPGRSHRHVGEVESVLAASTGHALMLTFCPHLLPVKRGILAALYLRSAHTPAHVAEALAAAYAGEPFVRVVSGPPRLSDVNGTNDCLMSVQAAAPGRVVVFSALDNLIKGAAGQAVQNLNLALGFDEQVGLPSGRLEQPA